MLCIARSNPTSPRKWGEVDQTSAPIQLKAIMLRDHRMLALEKITISPGLTFDALVAGKAGAPLVLLLHGFAESVHCWRAQVAALAAAGYRAIAPSQRGYSPGARPDTGDTANYHIDRLMDDAMAIVAASGCGDRRFHLAGHDWGGSIAWALADRFPAAGLAHGAVAAASQRLQSRAAYAGRRSGA
jgi:pimeloyl-ACP methyl ester carboxylesterase